MLVEIQVALNFILSFLYNKLPRRRVNQFGDELERAMIAKFSGHWYVDRPQRGSGYRCLKTSPPIDSIFERACQASGVQFCDIKDNLPEDLSLWIDPGEVSYKLNERAHLTLLYSSSNPIGPSASDQGIPNHRDADTASDSSNCATANISALPIGQSTGFASAQQINGSVESAGTFSLSPSSSSSSPPSTFASSSSASLASSSNVSSSLSYRSVDDGPQFITTSNSNGITVDHSENSFLMPNSWSLAGDTQPMTTTMTLPQPASSTTATTTADLPNLYMTQGHPSHDNATTGSVSISNSKSPPSSSSSSSSSSSLSSSSLSTANNLITSRDRASSLIQLTNEMTNNLSHLRLSRHTPDAAGNECTSPISQVQSKQSGSSPPLVFTAGMFAQTKFGSTKLRSGNTVSVSPSSLLTGTGQQQQRSGSTRRTCSPTIIANKNSSSSSSSSSSSAATTMTSGATRSLSPSVIYQQARDTISEDNQYPGYGSSFLNDHSLPVRSSAQGSQIQLDCSLGPVATNLMDDELISSITSQWSTATNGVSPNQMPIGHEHRVDHQHHHHQQRQQKHNLQQTEESSHLDIASPNADELILISNILKDMQDNWSALTSGDERQLESADFSRQFNLIDIENDVNLESLTMHHNQQQQKLKRQNTETGLHHLFDNHQCSSIPWNNSATNLTSITNNFDDILMPSIDNDLNSGAQRQQDASGDFGGSGNVELDKEGQRFLMMLLMMQQQQQQHQNANGDAPLSQPSSDGYEDVLADELTALDSMPILTNGSTSSSSHTQEPTEQNQQYQQNIARLATGNLHDMQGQTRPQLRWSSNERQQLINCFSQDTADNSDTATNSNGEPIVLVST